VIERVGAGDGI